MCELLLFLQKCQKTPLTKKSAPVLDRYGFACKFTYRVSCKEGAGKSNKGREVAVN